MIINRSGGLATSYRRRIATVQGMYAWQRGVERDACPFKVSRYGLGHYWQIGWDYADQSDGKWPDRCKQDLIDAMAERRRFRGWPNDQVTIA